MLAARHVDLEYRGRQHRVGNVRLEPRGVIWEHLPYLVQLAMLIIRVDQFLVGERIA